jgi:hypothetical protein
MAARLTDIAIRNARPRDKKYKLSAGRGLTLIVMPDGAKYWRLRYRFAGKEKELSLGRPYPELSLREAENRADQFRTVIAAGTDPSEQRLQAKIEHREGAASTFGVAAEAWFRFRKKAWATRTADQVRDYLDKDLLPSLGKRPLTAVTTRELASLTRKIEERAQRMWRRRRDSGSPQFSHSRAPMVGRRPTLCETCAHSFSQRRRLQTTLTCTSRNFLSFCVSYRRSTRRH